MPPDPPRMSCYAAELPSATVNATLLIPYWPYHPSDASYGPDEWSDDKYCHIEEKLTERFAEH